MLIGALVASGVDSTQLAERLSEFAERGFSQGHSLRDVVRGHQQTSAEKGLRYREYLAQQLGERTFGELDLPFVNFVIEEPNLLFFGHVVPLIHVDHGHVKHLGVILVPQEVGLDHV